MINPPENATLGERRSMRPLSSRPVLPRLACCQVLMLWAMTSGTTFAAHPQDWPAWRGPNANGSSLATASHQSATNPSVVWKLPLPGKGGSSPIVSKGVIYLTSPADGMDAILAVTLDGKEKWINKLGTQSPPRHRTLGSSCNSSPVTDGETVFAYFRSGLFAAVGIDGSLKWKQNLNEKFGAEQLYWDQGSSPILNENAVIITRLHQGESWVAAFDKRNGSLLWKKERNYQVPSENDNGYATPLLLERGSTKTLLVWGADHLTAHNPDNGNLLWSASGFNPSGTANWPAIATPVVHGDHVVVPVGRDDRPRQSSVYAVRLKDGPASTDSRIAWKRDDVGVFVPALAADESRVYLLRHKGDIACLDPKTGDTLWSHSLPKDRAPFYASPVIARNILYAAREDGMLFKAAVGDHFKLLGELPLGERVVASPAPAGDHLLVRGDSHLFCLK